MEKIILDVAKIHFMGAVCLEALFFFSVADAKSVFFFNWFCNDLSFFLWILLRLFILVSWVIFSAAHYGWVWAWIFTNQFEQTLLSLRLRLRASQIQPIQASKPGMTPIPFLLLTYSSCACFIHASIGWMMDSPLAMSEHHLDFIGNWVLNIEPSNSFISHWQCPSHGLPKFTDSEWLLHLSSKVQLCCATIPFCPESTA